MFYTLRCVWIVKAEKNIGQQVDTALQIIYHCVNEKKYYEMISNKLNFKEIVLQSVFENPMTNDALLPCLLKREEFISA